jgi:hypothetical protein
MNSNRVIPVWAWIGTLTGFVSVLSCPAWADEFKLKDGRVLAGAVKVKPKPESDWWVIEIAPATFVRFANSELSHNGYQKTNSRIAEYAEKLAEVKPNPQSHCDLAGWCTIKGLHAQAEAHYQRALDFDPDFQVARTQLKYRRDESGRWVRIDDFMTKNRGKIKEGSIYIYPEIKAIKEAKKEMADKTGQWRQKINQWVKQISSQSMHAQKNQAELEQIDDPYAIPALGELLLGKIAIASEPAKQKLKLIAIALLEQFQSGEATSKIVTACMTDPDPIISNACLESLTRNGREMAIARFTGDLRSSDPVTINRAATGLRILQAKTVVLPLIEALVTTHIVETKAADQIDNSGSFTMGGKPQKKKVPSQNEEVLKALASLTNQNFGYDEIQWKAWFASIYAAPVGDLRRDP